MVVKAETAKKPQDQRLVSEPSPPGDRPPLAEESISLRVLAQALAIIGMVATSAAAADVSAPIGSVVWAIPLSIAGSIWSYQRRRKRNITVKFLIAMGMLLALATFFQNLIAQSNDTRLVLAELLIQLQALHSFDLPRRKDLGYSIVIGLILLGVAATISQTWTFAPFLLGFLAIALPVLALDYRSRLGLRQSQIDPATNRKSKRFTVLPELSPRRLGWMLLIVIALGLVIFAVMPRLPGYQLRTFPVSTPINIQGEFDNQAISNPGYVGGGQQNDQNEDGDPSSVQGGSGSPTTGPGELDGTYYYGFNTQINMNLRGSLTPEIVMRVRSQAEGFWRVMAFDHYTGQGWEVSQNDATETLSRPRWTYRFRIPLEAPIPQERREIIQTYTIIADLPNLIPTLAWPEELYFPTQQIGMDSEGGLRSPVPLTDGITYSVVSEVPFRNRTILSQTGTDYPQRIRDTYLQVPENIRDRVAQATRELLAKSPKPLDSPYEQALYLTQALKQTYQLQPNLPFLEAQDDLVEAFLFEYGGGYPDHFSAALTIMLRSIGIPARLVVGYGPGEFNPFTGLYVVRNTDAYAMAEVYFDGAGWFAFDPIPGHDLIPPSIEDSYAFSTLKKIWQWAAGWLPSPLRSWLGTLFLLVGSLIGGVIGWIAGLFQQDWVSFLFGVLLLTIIGFSLWLIWGAFQEWRHRRWLAQLPPVEGLYRQMLDCLRQNDIHLHPAQTPLEFAQSLQSKLPQPQYQQIVHLCYAYVHWRYGGTSPDLAGLKHQLQQLQKFYQRSPVELIRRQFKRRKPIPQT